MEDQTEKEIKPTAVRVGELYSRDKQNMPVDSIRKGVSELFRSGGIRWAAGGLVSFFISIAWIARMRTIQQEIQRERELHGLRQVQQRGSLRRESNQEVNDSDFDDNDLGFTTAAYNEVVPPPPIPPPSGRSMNSASTSTIERRVGIYPGLCPICKQPRINPTASTGGYVFCLKCVLVSLRQNGPICPVTRKPCPESSLVRLYEPTHRA